MKKMMSDKSFWIILVTSVLSLVVLTVGVVFLTKQNAKEFYSAGYIINSSATKSDKYYFNDATVYRENVFNEYVFVDENNVEVTTSKDNFIHYLDNSLSFMKNGVILDLDNFNQSIVPYYNITDKSIVKYNNGGYYIETADKTLSFVNFLGRITDDKYIVVGKDISVKLAGSDTAVKGDYFEILFVENGIAKIENKEGSYQVVTDGTIIYVGDNIKINLGDKSVVYGDETKLSLNEMTIDGNENIDIVPEDGLIKEEVNGSDSGSGDGDGNGTGAGDGSGTGEGSGSGDGSGSSDGGGTNSDVDGETTTVLKKEVSVNLLEAYADVNSINARFQVIDTAEAINGDLKLTIANTTTGEVLPYEKVLVNTLDEQPVIINDLISDCNYVITITDDSGVQYFQKAFRTNSLDLKLKRQMVTESSLTYILDFGKNNNITSADVTIFDGAGNEIKSYSVYNGQDNKVTFNNLTNNTVYYVEVDNVFIENVGYGSYYSSRTSDITLKNKPVLGDVFYEVDADNSSVILKMDKPTDDDNAIISYTYQIFKSEDITDESESNPIPVYSFTKREFEDRILKVADIKELVPNKGYRYNVVVKYDDNYRKNQIITDYSDYFEVINKPTFSFEADVIDINTISGTIVVEDPGETISFENNNFSLTYSGGGINGEFTNNDFKIDTENKTIYFELTGLEAEKKYSFQLYGEIDLKNGSGLHNEMLYSFKEETAAITALNMEYWNSIGASYDNPISLVTKITSSDEKSIDQVASLKFDLYAGDVKAGLKVYPDDYSPIASFTITEGIKDYINQTKEIDVKSSMFEYVVNEETFKIDNLEVLKKLTGGKLTGAYTIKVSAKDETTFNEFPINNNITVYNTPEILILEDEVKPLKATAEPITNGETKSNEWKDGYGIEYISELGLDVVRGYMVTASFNAEKIKSTYNNISNPITKINFYVHNVKGEIVASKSINYADFGEGDEFSTCFFLDSGVGNEDVVNTAQSDKEKNILRRGNTYTFSYDISIDDDGNTNNNDLLFPISRTSLLSDPENALKQEPTIKMYVYNSDESSITYKYTVKDYDNALYMEEGKYYIYYNINDNDEVYKTEIVKDGSSDLFTLSNLTNASIYNINYYIASLNTNRDNKLVGNYFFDGYYDSSDYNIGYNLDYKEGNDNRLKIIIDDNELLNRVSSYLVTFKAGDLTQRIIVSDLEVCGENKCIVIDYSKVLDFKGKNTTVIVEGFYDSGYVGFGQNSKLGKYFETLGLVDSDNSDKVGFVYQTTGNLQLGKYFTINKNGISQLYDYPRGILGFELLNNGDMKLNTWNLIDEKTNSLVKFGDIKFSNSVFVSEPNNSIMNYFPNDDEANKLYSYTVNPKVLDKITLQSMDNNFMFTSVIPGVSATIKSTRINGVVMNIEPTLEPDVLKTDFVPNKDGKYTFHIVLYKEKECISDECSEVELEYFDTIDTTYDKLSAVEFQGLDPDTKYYYKITADMYKNGVPTEVPLLVRISKDGNYTYGYDVYEKSFSTLNASQILNIASNEYDVSYDYTSNIKDGIYNYRELTINSRLKTNINFDVKYELFDINGKLIFEDLVKNSDIVSAGSLYSAKYTRNITDGVFEDNFVFGEGYYKVVVTAVTTDLGKELELYSGMLTNKGMGKNYHALNEPEIIIRTIPSKVDYSITAVVTVTDTDKVIKDGKYTVELKYGSGENATVVKSASLDILNGKCTFNDGTCYISSQTAHSQVINIVFNNLKSDAPYNVVVSADIYRNNYGLDKKDDTISPSRLQYTISPLKFSLGTVTPKAEDKDNDGVADQIVITFFGAANVGDITNTKTGIVGIDYDVSIDGGSGITSGSFGTTDTTNGTLNFVKDQDMNPTITIPIPKDKKLGTSNIIKITYYYYEETSDGKLVLTKIDFGPGSMGSPCRDTSCDIAVKGLNEK